MRFGCFKKECIIKEISGFLNFIFNTDRPAGNPCHNLCIKKEIHEVLRRKNKNENAGKEEKISVSKYMYLTPLP